MSEEEIIALLAQALPALIDFVDNKFLQGKASAELQKAAHDVVGWFSAAKFDLPSQVQTANDALDLVEAAKFGK